MGWCGVRGAPSGGWLGPGAPPDELDREPCPGWAVGARREEGAQLVGVHLGLHRGIRLGREVAHLQPGGALVLLLLLV